MNAHTTSLDLFREFCERKVGGSQAFCYQSIVELFPEAKLTVEALKHEAKKGKLKPNKADGKRWYFSLGAVHEFCIERGLWS